MKRINPIYVLIALNIGLVHAEQANELIFYLALPILLLLAVTAGMIYIRKKYEGP